MTSGVKPWWKSKTIWAALGVFIITIAPELGVGINSDDAAGIGGAVGDIIAGGLALFAIIGRLRAKDRIGTPPKSDWGD